MGAGWNELLSLTGETTYLIDDHNVQDQVTLNYQVLPSGSTTIVGSVQSGTFVNAQVFREFNPHTPIGNVRWWTGTETVAGIKSLRIPRLVPQAAGLSWVVAFATQDSAVISGSATAGLVARTHDTNKFNSILVADTTGSTTELLEGQVNTVGGTGRDWFSASVEVRAEENSAGTTGFVLNEPGVTGAPVGLTISPGSVIVPVTFPSFAISAGGPPGGGGPNPSGKRIESPAPGFTRLHYSDFLEDRTLGTGIHPNTHVMLRPRPNAGADGSYWDSSQRGNYNWTRTTEQRDSMLRIWLHTEQVGQSGIFHVPNPTGAMKTGPGATNPNTNGDWINYVSAPLSQANQRWAFDVHFTARFPLIVGRKMAHLSWAGGAPVGATGYGEEDYPEGKMDGGSAKGNAFHHYWQSSQQESMQLQTNLQNWHYYKFRFWARGYQGHPTGYFACYLDGVLKSPHAPQPFTANVPPDDMYFVLQIETYLKGQTIPTSNIGQGWVEYDEYAFDVPTSGMGL